MRDWTLAPGDPLTLILAADFRLCTTDYANDQIWEIETGGDPPALALCTTYGLRARLMRIFPRFTLGSQAITDPAAFLQPPRLRRFYPNFLLFDFSPFSGMEVAAGYWAVDSHTIAGRFTITNRQREPFSFLLELCGQLAPLDGQSLASVDMQSVNVMVGQTSNLAPVLFLTGGPVPGPGPFPSLAVDLTLAPGASHTFTWAQAALANPSESFEQARKTAARPWEAEQARIEQINASQTFEISTGDPDWDAALALGQKAAFGLFLSATEHLPYPSFVLSRQPDHGYSPRGDGSDYASLWNGQPPLDATTIAGLLPGAPELAAGLVRNFLAVQTGDGGVDWKPGLAGQRGRWLAAPLLAGLAWKTYQRNLDSGFLRDVEAGLHAFIKSWFAQPHDRDQDGFPEWDYPLQMGLEDNPAFTIWHACGQGAEISAAESPALAAMAYREILSLASIARVLDQPEKVGPLELRSTELRRMVETCWDEYAGLYHARDRVSHLSPAGKLLAKQSGSGELVVGRSLGQPVRLLVRIELKGESTRRPQVSLHGLEGDTERSECLERMDFQWGAGLAIGTSRLLYTRLDKIKISGLESRDRVSVQIMDFTCEDISLFLPLWAGIPAPRRAQSMVKKTLFSPQRFGRPFGIPTCPSVTSGRGKTRPDDTIESICQAVHLPWNILVGEGLLAYGLRAEAAELVGHLMTPIIQNLKVQHAFRRAYHAVTGEGIGERNALAGLPPLGLFLDVLGVAIQSPGQVTLSGKNPFPWPVTVKYRGLAVTRQAEQTVIVFPDGQIITLDDPTEAVVSAG